MTTANVLELKLKPGEERRIEGGHCWIFSNELQEVPTNVEPGSQCRVVYPDGRPLCWGYFNHKSLIAVRVLSRGAQPPEDNFIRVRLERALKYRQSLGLGNFCRVCFGESDGLPGLVVDAYGEYLTVEILTAGMEKFKKEIDAALRAMFSPKGIVYRNDSEFRTLEGLTNLNSVAGEVPPVIEVKENGLTYLASPQSGQKTGFYYDQRENRAFLLPYFSGRSVLDLHCFTGGFSFMAAKGGADKVWGVDTSAAALELARAGAEKNGFTNIMFNKQDAEEMLHAAAHGELPEKPDFILLDPPPMARSKKHLAQARKLYVRFNMLAMKALPEGGYLATSSCSHHISRSLFEEILRESARKSGRQAFVVETRGQAKDHPVLAGMPETSYLNFVLLRVL